MTVGMTSRRRTTVTSARMISTTMSYEGGGLLQNTEQFVVVELEERFLPW